jgi:hypothetical protein
VARGRVRLDCTCFCGHLYTRSETHPWKPEAVARATALTQARAWVGHDAPLAGVAIYQAITENA